MDKKKNKYLTSGICLILAATTFAVYWQVHSYEFVTYDDNKYVYDNPNVTAGLTGEGIKWALTTGYFSYWHPLTWMSHMVDCELFGLNAGRHHFVNLLFHIANTLLLFIVLKRMTCGLWQSAFVAAAFALHPLHVESVAWVAERKDLLSCFFWLVTMGVYMRYTRRPAAGRYLLTLAAFAMGLMSKPTVVTLPFALLLLDYWPLGRFEDEQRVKEAEEPSRELPKSFFPWRTFYRLVLEKVPFFALSVFSGIVTFLNQQTGDAVVSLQHLSIVSRIANAVTSYVRYLGKMIWPSRLAVFYPHSYVKTIPVWQIGVSAMILLVISLVVVRLFRTQKYLATGWLWFLGTLVPMIGLVQVGGQGFADRYSYIPFTGLFIIIAWGAPELLQRLPYRKVIIALAAVVLISAMMVRTWVQTGHWQNNYTLFSHAVAVTENNSNMNYDLAVTLYNQGRLDEAIIHYREALRIEPGNFKAHVNLGIALSEQGQYDEALEHFNIAVRLDPDSHDAHYNLGLALLLQGRLNEAAVHLKEAIRIKANWPETHNKLASVYLRQGKPDDAIIHYEYSLELNPDQPQVHRDLGLLFHRQGNFERVIYHWQKALELNPGNIELMNNLAWIMATHPDTAFRNPEKAIRLAERACKLSNYEISGSLDTLSAAYAAAGKFAEAITTAEKALQLAVSSGQTDFAEEIRKRLNLYKAAKPYTEAPQQKSAR